MIFYFTGTGNTKAVAEVIAASTGGELYEIVRAKPGSLYRGIIAAFMQQDKQKKQTHRFFCDRRKAQFHRSFPANRSKGCCESRHQ